MPRVSDVLAAIESLAPWSDALPNDKVGLQVGDPSAPVTRVFVALDRSLAMLEKAAASGAEMVISHHPLIWDPIKRVVSSDTVGRSLQVLIGHGMALAGVHTNWDVAVGGITETMAALLELSNLTSFGEGAPCARLKLVFFVPVEAADAVIDALSAAGAGRVGFYERVAFSGPGMGTFVPLKGANPSVGAVGRRETVAELRVEMEVSDGAVEKCVAALLAAHPYEEVAYDLFRQEPRSSLRLGRVGRLAKPMSLREFGTFADERFQTRSWVWGDPDRIVERVGVVGGAGDSEWPAALAAGAEVFLTGEVAQHQALEATRQGLCMVASGHYATEHPGCVALAAALRSRLPEIEWVVYEPEPGRDGRPF
jgi:dinuclear metal center YbgI/SA1388 family protein